MATEANQPIQAPKPRRARRVVGKLRALDFSGFPSVESTMLAAPPLPEYPWRPEDLDGDWERFDPDSGQMVPMPNPYAAP